MKAIAAAIAGLVAFVLGIAVVVAGAGFGEEAAPPSAAALEEIPRPLLSVYVGAAAACPGLPWQVLAAIGYMESRHGDGRVDHSTGAVHPEIIGPALDGTSGTRSIADPSRPSGWAHALGPMQFLTTTWAQWGRLAPGRPSGITPDPHNAWDAIHSAAAYLCGLDGQVDDVGEAVMSYNPSSEYVEAVLAKAVEYDLRLGGRGDGLYCPVAGPVTFTDDWGAPRSGGRSHKGNDLFASHGTPLVAIEAGVISRASSVDRGLGGITLWLRGDSGDAYYYAHNSRNAAVAGERVEPGQVIAYVGNTGNAATTPPHVHFEIHPDGGEAVNPYPVISASCAS